MSEVVEKSKQQIAEFREFEGKLEEFRQRYDGVVYDLDKPKELKQAKSDRYAIARVISALDARHKEVKAPLYEQVQLIDGARKRIKDELLEVQRKIKSQLEEREERLQGMVDRIKKLTSFDETVTSEDIAARLDHAVTIEITDDYAEKKADAALALTAAVNRLREMLKQQKDLEEREAELKRLRAEKEKREREERERKVREEAEARAKQEAERKAKEERDRIQRAKEEAEERAEAAERARKKAVEDSKRAAEEAARKERERIQREREEQERKEAEKRRLEAQKKAEVKHRESIQAAVAKDLVAAGVSKTKVAKVVRAIDTGKVRHLVIEY